MVILAGHACTIRRCTKSRMNSVPNVSCAMGSSIRLCVIRSTTSLGMEEGKFSCSPVFHVHAPAVLMSHNMKDLPRAALRGRYDVHQHGLRATLLRHRATPRRSWRAYQDCAGVDRWTGFVRHRAFLCLFRLQLTPFWPLHNFTAGIS